MSSSGRGYTHTGSGTNSQGNHWCSRDTSRTRKFLSTDDRRVELRRSSNGSYYYSNSNGSTYYHNGKGDSVYTPPGGKK
ncbi:hypothetical protein HFD88_005804 [Aspergillus terreus]|nr:hypothetical protein HFD88_005804 [Aspergillus terreus]